VIDVSIVLTVYNAESYIEGCLDMITGQTLRNIQIICVDDGSTDNSSQIIEQYAQKDDRIVLIREKNAGAGAARNRGMQEATGKYILFLDCDDFYEPEMVEKAFRRAEEEQAELDSKLADSNNIPEDITDAFEKYGGVLNFSQQYTVFGQVYDGMDIYDEICGTDVADSETLKPREDIQFTKVYMSTYGENKNSNAFAGSADSSEVSESAVDSADTSSEM